MPLADILDRFRVEVRQCDDLIVHAHAVDAAGNSVLPELDRKQVTAAAFLNMFIAWETFLESAFVDYMTGETTISGRSPVRYVMPQNPAAAKAMLIGINRRYFDFGNHDFVRKMASIFFQNGDPFEPHLSSLVGDLADIRTMRNASAHITSTTQAALEAFALRLFGAPRPNIDLYGVLTSRDPAGAPGQTILALYRNKLLTGATLIATG